MRFPFKLPDAREFDVVGFGTNAVDFLIRVPEYPNFNSKVELTDYTRLAGGEIASTMVGLRRLGLKACYVGRFGDDDAGSFGLKSLQKENVDVSHAETVPGAATQIAFIVIDERTGERTVIWKRDARLAYSKDEVPLDLAGKCRLLHFTPHDAEACIALATRARAAGAIVSIDLDNEFPKLNELLPLVDVLITSAELPAKMFGIDDIRETLKAMRSKFGSSILGVTLGESGSLLLCGDTFIETPGFPVPGGCKDTTGAGDSFRTGLIYGLLTGETVEDSARTANAVAALKCRAIGARTSLPNLSEVQTLLNNR